MRESDIDVRYGKICLFEPDLTGNFRSLGKPEKCLGNLWQ